MSDGLVLRIERAVTVLTGLALTLWGLQCTLIAFSGGTFPVPAVHWQTNGNWLLGVMWLLYVSPLVTGAACLATITLTGRLLSLQLTKTTPVPPSVEIHASTSNIESEHHTDSAHPLPA